MDTPVSLHGCYVQCWTCHDGAHDRCITTACQCQSKAGLSNEMVQRLVERSRSGSVTSNTPD
jgi:hypothetical protein